MSTNLNLYHLEAFKLSFVDDANEINTSIVLAQDELAARTLAYNHNYKEFLTLATCDEIDLSTSNVVFTDNTYNYD